MSNYVEQTLGQGCVQHVWRERVPSCIYEQRCVVFLITHKNGQAPSTLQIVKLMIAADTIQRPGIH